MERIEYIDSQIKLLDDMLALVKDDSLLKTSVRNGEISFTEYLYSSELYFTNKIQLLELKKDRLLLEAELLKVYY